MKIIKRVAAFVAPELFAALRALRAEAATLRAGLDGLRAENGARRAEIDDLRTGRDALRVDIEKLQAEIEKLRTLLPTRAPKRNYVPDVFGHKMFVAIDDDGIDLEAIAGRSVSEWTDIACEIDQIRAGDTVLDIGANIGLNTLLFAQKTGPAGKVYAFEPGPQSFALLAKNIAVNGYQTITAINAAVSDFSGSVELHICRSGESDNRIEGTLSDYDDRDPITVPCHRLDDYFPDVRIGFIKIDVQGAEAKVFAGMRQIIARNPHIRILLEYTPGGLRLAGVDPREFLTTIRSTGLRIFDTRGGVAEIDDEAILSTYGPTGIAQTDLLLTRGL